MKRFQYLLILVITTCCSMPEENKIIKAITYSSLQIPVNQNFSPDRTRTQYIKSDSGEYLAILNKIGPAVEIYNLDSKKLAKRIKLNQDGPNRIGLDNGFYLMAPDSLYLASIPPKILILNFQGEILKKIPVTPEQNSVNFLTSNNELPFLFDDEFLFGAQPFFQNIFQMKENDLKTTKHLYKINLKDQNNTTEWLEVFRPSDSWKNGKKDGNFSWTDRYDSILVAPYTDHRIWLISKKNGELINYFSLKSNSFNEFRLVGERVPVGDQGIIEDLEKGRYEIILHDHYRDVFYRFFFPGVNWEETGLTPRDLFSNRSKIGIMVIDPTLKIIGEHIFEKNRFQMWNYFVGRKGLYVSTNNPNREDFDENYLRYDIIRFEGLEYED
jgi:hypothetical protein